MGSVVEHVADAALVRPRAWRREAIEGEPLHAVGAPKVGCATRRLELALRAGPFVAGAAADVDEARADEAYEVVGVVRELARLALVLLEVLAEPELDRVVEHPVERLGLGKVDVEVAGAAGAGAVGDRERDALVLRGGPEGGLSSAAVADHADARDVDLRLLLDPVHDARDSPGPRRERAPRVGLAGAVDAVYLVRPGVVVDVQRHVVDVEVDVGVAARDDRVRRRALAVPEAVLASGAVVVVDEDEGGGGVLRAGALGEDIVDADLHLSAGEGHSLVVERLVGRPARRVAVHLAAEPVERRSASASVAERPGSAAIADTAEMSRRCFAFMAVL